MPRLFRPPIPLVVRLAVALRQIGWAPPAAIVLRALAAMDARTLGHELAETLSMLAVYLRCSPSDLHLDHDPALGARRKVYVAGVHVDYDPPANDPNHLVYREASAHRVKTNVRGDHGQYPDRVLIKKNRQLERGPKPKPKKRWPSRPLHGNTRWPPKGSRKIQARKS